MGVVAVTNGSAAVNEALGTAPYPCLASLLVGDLVYLDSGNVRLVDRLDSTKMPAVGCVVLKLSPTIAKVQFIGVIKSVYTGLIAGADYFVGADGRPTSSISIAPTTTIFAQSIGFAIDANTLFLKPDSNMKRMR